MEQPPRLRQKFHFRKRGAIQEKQRIGNAARRAQTIKIGNSVIFNGGALQAIGKIQQIVGKNRIFGLKIARDRCGSGKNVAEAFGPRRISVNFRFDIFQQLCFAANKSHDFSSPV